MRSRTDSEPELSLSATRTLRILSSFNESQLDLGLTDLSDALSLSKPSVARFLSALEKHGYVDRDLRTRRYRPGLEAFRVGQLFLRSGGLQERARPLMVALVDRTGLTSYLSALHGDSVVILAAVEGQGRIRYSIPIGEKLPIHATATGQAALAALDRDAAGKIIRDLVLSSRTPDTIVDPDRLAVRIELCRQRGYALNWQENTVGVASVAAATLDPISASPIVLSLGFPTSQVPRAQCNDLGWQAREAVDSLFDEPQAASPR